jgi:hypothetical protein
MWVRKGTMIMPPPMPKSPAKKPVPMPMAANSRMSRGSSVIVVILAGLERPERGVCGYHWTVILNRGSGGLGQKGVGFV